MVALYCSVLVLTKYQMVGFPDRLKIVGYSSNLYLEFSFQITISYSCFEDHTIERSRCGTYVSNICKTYNSFHTLYMYVITYCLQLLEPPFGVATS